MKKTIISAFLLSLACFLSVAIAAEEKTESSASTTTSDPAVPVNELALLLGPLSKDELLIEAEAWRMIVKVKAEEVARAEIAVLRENSAIEKAEALEAKIQAAMQALNEVAKRLGKEMAVDKPEKISAVQQATSTAHEAMQAVAQAVDETLKAAKRRTDSERGASERTRQHLDELVEASAKAQQAVADVRDVVVDAGGKSGAAVAELVEKAEKATEDAQLATEVVQQKVELTLASAKADVERAADLEEALTDIDQAEAVEEKKKLDLLQSVTTLREQRTRLLDNMRAVVDELEAKSDTGDTDTQATIRDYRLYLGSVSGIHVDVTDTTSAWVSLKGWLTSQEGGLRWLENIGSFIAILVLAWFLSDFVRRLTRKVTGRLSLPALLTDFLVRSARWVVMIIGIIWALSALEVSVAPLLAMVGAAGFIIAFAMQDSLSNFASGLMILFFRPFDIGDLVDAGGVSGKVSSMNLVSTTIRTVDNKLMVVPNSKIWSDVITNVTGVTQRRVDMEFGIGYSDDIDRAEQILEQIVADDPRILKDPAPVIRLSALADSSVNFICRPWTTPGDYWDVYWDVTREVKRRFDAANIGIPFPQRDVHLYIKDGWDGGVSSTNGQKPDKVKSSGEPQPVDAVDNEQQV